VRETPRSHREREQRSNRLLIGALGGLLLVAAIAVAVAVLRPSGKAGASPEAVSEHTTPAPAPAPTPTASATPSTAPEATPTAATQAPIPSEAAHPANMVRLLPDSRQIIVITGARIGSNTGALSVYNLDDGRWSQVLTTSANFGKNGLFDGEKRTSGHLQTPTGIWFIGGFLFGQHASAPTGTKMPYRRITANSWWSAESNSTYNQWVESKARVNGEHLADARVQYEYAFDTGYNAPPNKQVVGRGTAIFIHCFEPPNNSLGKFTHGCVAVSRTDILRLFSVLDPERRPSCAIGTLSQGSPTSIWAY
jgi:L,D-peptidoglycan transpeptidase YkuD (ErfK/YbiS/YcfS/YnhG family)